VIGRAWGLDYTKGQLTGRARSEATLLQLGMQFQARTTFHRRRPPVLRRSRDRGYIYAPPRCLLAGARVTASVLPPSPAAFARATWDDVAPYFDDLLERPLDAGTVQGWLLAWSRLEELVTEAAALAMIAYTIDTSDPEKEKDHLRFSTEIMPKMEERSVELARRFVALGYTSPELATTRARFRTSIEIFREANVPIFSELEELSARYQRITGSMTVEWEGVERPLPQLQPFLKSPDRAVRERAFRASTQPYIE